MESNTATAPQPAKVLPPNGEIVIELGTKQNQKVLFHPTGETFRGRWEDSMMKGQSSVNFPELQSLPDVPGIHISINARQGNGRIYDPLAASEHRALVVKLQAIGKKIDGKPGAPVLSPDGPSERKMELNVSQVKTWLYWMRILVDSGCAVERKGELPEMEDIEALEGRTQIGSKEGGNIGLGSLEALKKHLAKSSD
jgi:hypothetical protein